MKSELSLDICCVLNYAPHYREEVFLLIDEEFKCDFYFGDSTYGAIEKVNYSIFKNKVRELKFIKIFKKFYWLRGQVSLIFSKHKYYIITGQSYNLSAWLFILLSKLFRKKKIFIWNHGYYGNEGQIQRILKKLQAHLVSGYLLYGDYARDLMMADGINGKKLHCIYNSLHYNRQKAIREKLNRSSLYRDYFKNDYPTLIFIGRLTAIKKLDLLIQAMKLSHDDGHFFNLTIIGDGAVKTELINLSNSLNLAQHIWFYGKSYDEEEIADLIYNADVCVSPGNVGLTAIHSLSYGTPVISHNNFTKQMPEYESITPGVNGNFFTENDIDSLKLTIQLWLKEHPTKSKEEIEKCFAVIDTRYNPNFQIELLKKVLV